MDPEDIVKYVRLRCYILYPNCSEKVFQEFLNGGRVLVDRKKYDDWKKFKHISSCFGSSHYTERGCETIRVQIGSMHAVFGVIGNCTWVQLEETNPCFAPFRHLLHYCSGIINRRNIGPYGSSQFTESNPLNLC